MKKWFLLFILFPVAISCSVSPEYVQLWDGGPYWCTHNLGACESYEPGDYYAWGESEPKTEFGWETYLYTEEDPAAALGEGWHTPSASEWRELMDRCAWNWEGSGFKVTGPNGNSIFLPAGGYYTIGRIRYPGDLGYYWTSTTDSLDATGRKALMLYMNENYSGLYSINKDCGRSIRPVKFQVKTDLN